jgi:NADPH:quinone reductase-like Zn-dependent oxidoreductase
MPWQRLRISRFGGPEVLQVVEESAIPEPGLGEVRIKVLAAGTGFSDTMIRRGRYPDFKGPLPFTPGYEIVGVIEKTGAGVVAPLEGEMVADLCVVGGYAQYAIRPRITRRDCSTFHAQRRQAARGRASAPGQFETFGRTKWQQESSRSPHRIGYRR